MWLKILSFSSSCLLLSFGLVQAEDGAAEAILSNPKFLTDPSSEIMINLREPVSPILKELAARRFLSRADRLNTVARTLKAFTALSQAPVVAVLRSFKVDFKPFWVTNRIHVKNANPALVKLLMKMEQIKEIRAPRFPSLPPLKPIEGTPPEGIEWNVEIINAPEVWKKGSNGSGVIVLGIDTGVRVTHNALKDAFVGLENKGWFDAWYRQSKPGDINGHGTHTIATVLGRTGTGVAPGAQFMACRACDTQGCPEPGLLECAEFANCPTDPDGRNSKCEMAPHIVTNSWGGGAGDSFFDDAIAAWEVNKIIAIFAIGNDGPKCNTAASPGDRDGVLAVGASDKDDNIAKFSSRGPRKDPQTEGIPKPQVVAPGHKVNSAFMVSDNAYRVLSGTSMACPAVAGAAALLVAKNPDLTTETITALLQDTAYKGLQSSGQQCGENTDDVYPNEVYGYGRIDCLSAYNKMMETMVPSEPEPSMMPPEEPSMAPEEPTMMPHEPTIKTPARVR